MSKVKKLLKNLTGNTTENIMEDTERDNILGNPKISACFMMYNGNSNNSNNSNNGDTFHDVLEEKDIRRVGKATYIWEAKPDIEGKMIEGWQCVPEKVALQRFKGYKGCKDTFYGLPVYSGFVCVPSHTDYKEIYGNYVNSYHKLPHQPEEGECPLAEQMISRMFGDKAEMFWEYLAVMYQNPRQPLPIVCLVSRENATGKTTLFKLIHKLFGANTAFGQASDLESTFNSWVKDRLCVFFEEMPANCSKRLITILKNASTADSMLVNEKYEKQEMRATFVKIMLATNNEVDFIQANKEDLRYWVVKVPIIKEEEKIPDFDEQLFKEVPQILHKLENYSLNERKSRMWFAPEDYRTEAFERVVSASLSDCVKDLATWASGLAGTTYMTEAKIVEALSKRYKNIEVRNALKDVFKLDNPNRKPEGRAYEINPDFFYKWLEDRNL